MLFSHDEYQEYQSRIAKVKKSMEEKGIEVLLVTNPSNMNYLTGYDGWSFYVDQMVAVIIDEDEPLWIGRYQDANGAKATVWLDHNNIIPYPDEYVQSQTRHPMDFIADFLTQIGQAKRKIGVELESYYFTALAYERLKAKLPDATFKDGSLLVNYVRIIKSEMEIDYMKKAATIVEKAMQTAVNSIHVGARQCDAIASIYYDLITGTSEYGGDYPAIVPLMPTGENTSAPHLTWSDQPFKDNDMVIIEIAGCFKRYHAPLARTVSLGKPSEKVTDLSKVVVEGLNHALDAVKPGNTCEDIEAAWRKVISKHGIEKEARLGYSMGLSYPPDWGEHTASIRKGDKTILKPNMTFHLIPALWFENYGIEISESFRVTDQGVEVLTNYTRELIVKGDFDFEEPVIS
ncbi:M24 family metallopeptidase [Ornithinibacillus halophilus]|uniref:Xaa-Pro dipeptidase n=1 Tax=Ornithinibacillus halophilus TaxID=930117 RepID=A0A1M5MIT0_9BACI|nr:M24 family metallopeptidase [Ornithinibacillus halophilus]SHG77374.1 Xaa-Pro dipeptidase [Ornithinibacillus halophilus]